MELRGADDAGRAEYRGYLSKVSKEAGFAFSGKVFGLVFGFASQAVIANLLGADLLGVFVLAWTTIQAFAIVTTFGFEGSLIRYISMYVAGGRPGAARRTLLLALRIGVGAAAAGVVAIILLRRPLALDFFKEPRLVDALVWISFMLVPFTVMKILSGAMRGLKDVKRDVLGSDISYRVMRLVAFLGFYLVGWELKGIIGAAIVASSFAASVLIGYVRRNPAGLFRADVGRGEVPAREFVVYSSAMLADAAMAFGMQRGDRLILGFYLPSAAVGIYNVAALIAGLTTFVLLSFNAIFSSVIADVYHRGRQDLLRSLFRSVTRWIMIPTLAIYAWILAGGDATLSVFGDEFVSGYPALAFLATGMTFGASAGSVGLCLAMTGHQRYNVWNTLAMAALSIGLNMVLVPRMGIAGSGLATGTAFVLVNIARIIEVRVLLGVSPYGRATWKVLATAAVVLVVAFLVRRYVDVPRNLVGSVLTLIGSAGLVGALTWLLGISEEDRMILDALAARFARIRGRR
ncbi:MAG: oligosaccharide flippase family protein [Candidatus Eisenbacteria bacterium]|nr:oligosaccharide flippase family protein [Candidatus Eisenbacteria bacterium]